MNVLCQLCSICNSTISPNSFHTGGVAACLFASFKENLSGRYSSPHPTKTSNHYWCFWRLRWNSHRVQMDESVSATKDRLQNCCKWQCFFSTSDNPCLLPAAKDVPNEWMLWLQDWGIEQVSVPSLSESLRENLIDHVCAYRWRKKKKE